MSGPTDRAAGEPLLAVRDLRKSYRLARGRAWRAAPTVAALAGVDFDIPRAETFAIVGETGSGKSTLARLVMGLERPDHGSIRILGHDINRLDGRARRRLRRHFQMVFQDPDGSLDPRRTVRRIVAEPLHLMAPMTARAREELIVGALEAVGLGARDLDKYPHEFSGGQRQRIAIARALITRPDLVVADEPVSALDVSIQAQVLNLLLDLKTAYDLTYLFISHDLAVVDYIADWVAVLYAGEIVERAARSRLFSAPRHPYTQMLLAAQPRLPPDNRPIRRAAAAARPVSTAASPACPFAPRCPMAQERCERDKPRLRTIAPGHSVSCHFA